MPKKNKKKTVRRRPVFSEMSDVMSSVGPTALEAQPGANFVVEALRAYFGMPRLLFYLCDMRTSAFLGTWYIHGHRWLRALDPGAGRGPGGGAQLNQFPSWLLANCSHTKTRAFFLSFRRWGAGPTGWPERKRGLYGVKLRGSVMLLLMSLIECYSLCSQSVSLIGQRSKKKRKKKSERSVWIRVKPKLV